jgi:crotonobetainyl-CoA:carnitine CoA-transferase CaiB-like acyl-CoA transferase
MVVEIDHPRIGRMRSLGIPVKSTGELLEIRKPAPWLGQHTNEVLNELGYNTADIEKLYSEGVLYDKYRDQPAAQASVPHSSPATAAE